jgi:sigma-B regulation protein RsbU (phosphoserine phosphatase)
MAGGGPPKVPGEIPEIFPDPSDGAGPQATEAHGCASLYGIDLAIPLHDRRILIADSSPFSRKTLTRFLSWFGVTDVVFAKDGKEVLDRVSEVGANLILLDTNLGSLTGIETCRLLRATPTGRDLPILLQTTSHSDQTRARCFQAGASDVISKPVNPGELIARVGYHLERRAMIAELKRFRERIELDLAMARAMQLALIPKPEAVAAAARTRGLAIDSHFESCDEIGGDLWSLHEIDDHRLGILLADFSGHGITAAINAFRFEALVSRRTDAERADPGAMLTELNAELCDILPPGQYCTAFYGVLDSHRRTLTYASAAQPNPFLTGPGGRITTLDGSGVFLGCWPGERYDSRHQDLEPDGSLFLYSDVLTEAPDHQGAALAERGLEELVQAAAQRENPLETLLDRFAAPRRRPYPDDLTALWIAWGKKSGALPDRR